MKTVIESFPKYVAVTPVPNRLYLRHLPCAPGPNTQCSLRNIVKAWTSKRAPHLSVVHPPPIPRRVVDFDHDIPNPLVFPSLLGKDRRPRHVCQLVHHFPRPHGLVQQFVSFGEQRVPFVQAEQRVDREVGVGWVVLGPVKGGQAGQEADGQRQGPRDRRRWRHRLSKAAEAGIAASAICCPAPFPVEGGHGSKWWSLSHTLCPNHFPICSVFLVFQYTWIGWVHSFMNHQYTGTNLHECCLGHFVTYPRLTSQ